MSKSFGIEYPWRDGMYVIEIKAGTEAEAMERLRQAANHGRCFTPHGQSQVVMQTRFGAAVETWLRNTFARPR